MTIARLIALCLACGFLQPVIALEIDRAPSAQIDIRHLPLPMPRPEKRSKYGNRASYEVHGRTYQVDPTAEDYRQAGVASWYGEKFHGRRTSSGEIYNMYKFTAAHRSLPLPTWVKVTNTDNGVWLYVRVNDRGPFHEDRIIDLSYASAVYLDMLEEGTANVLLEYMVARNDVVSSSHFMLQAGAFIDATVANQLAGSLDKLVQSRVSIEPVIQAGETIFRVHIGPFRSIQEARDTQDFVKSNLNDIDIFVVEEPAF